MNVPAMLRHWHVGVFWLEGMKTAMSVTGPSLPCHALLAANERMDLTADKGADRTGPTKDGSGHTASNADGLTPTPAWPRSLLA